MPITINKIGMTKREAKSVQLDKSNKVPIAIPMTLERLMPNSNKCVMQGMMIKNGQQLLKNNSNFQRPKDSPKNPSPIMIRTVPKNRSRPLHFIPVPPLRKAYATRLQSMSALTLMLNEMNYNNQTHHYKGNDFRLKRYLF